MNSTKSKIKIRKAELHDVKTLIPLMEQLGYQVVEADLMARIALYQHSLTNCAWVAVQDEEVIGCLAVHIYDLFHSTERYARITTLIVKDTYRRQGIGRRLVKIAERFAKEKDCSTLELSSSLKRTKSGSHLFYKALDYGNEGEYETRYFRKFLKPKIGPLL